MSSLRVGDMLVQEIDVVSFENDWHPRRSRIFRDSSDSVEFFADTSWAVLPLPGGLMLDAALFEPIAASAQRMGDERFVVAGMHSEFDDQPAFLLPWNINALHAVATETVLGHILAVCFGRSETWGMVAAPEGYCVLGGVPEFIQRGIELGGGETALAAAFRHAALPGELGLGEHGLKFVNDLLARASCAQTPPRRHEGDVV